MRVTKVALTILLSAGFVVTSLASSAFAAPKLTELAAKPAKPVKRLDAYTAKGGQLPADALEVKWIEKQGERGVLWIRNRTPFLVLVYVRGVRMGWLRGYRTGIIRGLRNGYHRVYAHSRWGSTYWGPRVLWVSSRWTLYR